MVIFRALNFVCPNMKLSRISVISCIPFLLVSLYGIVFHNELMVHASYTVIFFLLLAGFFKKLDFSNWNLNGFLGLMLISTGLNFFHKVPVINLVALTLQLASYFFLIKEALKNTKRESANRYMQVFFFLIVAVNIYFQYQHFKDMDLFVLGTVEFSFYSVYYLSLLVLAITALMYYLNSYSKKSVFFISLVMAIVISDVLRDMAAFYLRDTSVLFVESFLRFWSIVLAFKFFSVKEKKLRLINMV